MTIRSFLKAIKIDNQATAARYPDGSGGGDNYMVAILLDGHGNLLNAKIKNVVVSNKVLTITAKGVD